ncbi:unnamed protein product [Rhizoctonia solani]|uniref:G domain-containing protein n=1 Tax=Rhizoctonia solani TaxID=456999 RepID=A0A8H3CZU4_9AGAM|nr:unnamed protein product [Rhizoctonia solani]CAE6506260.1 unnamed protein product [Rhizoctonia solani]
MLFGLFGSSTQSEQYELGRPLTRRAWDQTPQDYTVILVLGRSGTGKSYLIDAVSHSDLNESMPQHGGTSQVTAYRSVLSGVRYKLIDTPGFDNMRLGDVEICARIVKYLRDSKVAKGGIHGIIYIHQSGDPLRGESFYRYLRAVSQVFFGSLGLRRLTVLVRHVDPDGPASTHINDELRNATSTLGRLRSLGAKIMPANHQTREFIEVMQSYSRSRPILLPIQEDRPNIIADLEAILHKAPAQTRQGSQEERISRSYERQLEDLHLILDAKESELVHCRDALHRVELHRDGLQETETTLRQKLQQMQREYTSLRSELQLQENFEQSDIVQELEDLNRHIDDISRSISAHLTDNYVRTILNKDPAEATTQHAQNLPGLFKLLGIDESTCSVVSSEKGEGLDIESFLDFTIRDMLCTLLVTAVFQPFHPAIDSEQSTTLLRIYEDIQKQEPQTRSGKWRSSTFKSIHKCDSPDVANDINRLLHLFIRERLNPLIMNVFGSKDATLDRDHFNQMHGLVKRAREWNSKLKGEVIVLGDFRLTIHAPGSHFDSNTMKDFEPQPSVQPISILGTVGLGLVSLRAVGGGRPPEETLVCKAVVTTNTLYA